MQRYIAQLNIEHFEQQAAAETDPKKLAMLRFLLAEEKAKLATLLAEAAKPSAPKAANASDER